jgi:predicted small metal-binding protein
MKVEIGCRELGEDCDFVAEGESADEVLSRFMRHVEEEHADDWFAMEESFSAARELVRRRVA